MAKPREVRQRSDEEKQSALIFIGIGAGYLALAFIIVKLSGLIFNSGPDNPLPLLFLALSAIALCGTSIAGFGLSVYEEDIAFRAIKNFGKFNTEAMVTNVVGGTSGIFYWFALASYVAGPILVIMILSSYISLFWAIVSVIVVTLSLNFGTFMFLDKYFPNISMPLKSHPRASNASRE